MNYQQLLEQLKKDLPLHTGLLPTGLWGWLFLVLLCIAIMWGLAALYRFYAVWSSHKVGQADLAQANNEQQIQVARARGRLNAAELNKQAEIIGAEAVAKSVEIIGTALHQNQGYLQWKWIHMMEERDSGDTIYVPTEASLPILEAGKRKERSRDEDND